MCPADWVEPAVYAASLILVAIRCIFYYSLHDFRYSSRIVRVRNHCLRGMYYNYVKRLDDLPCNIGILGFYDK
jgi:hypothetical protein